LREFLLENSAAVPVAQTETGGIVAMMKFRNLDVSFAESESPAGGAPPGKPAGGASPGKR